MIELDYDKLETAKVEHEPFAHVVVADFVPPEALRSVIRDLPPLNRRGSFPATSVALGPIAADLMREMEGERMRGAIARKFGLDLSGSPTMLTLRGRTEAKDGRIHCDSTAKRVTVLLYLNPESDAFASQDGCLRLLRGPDRLDDYVVEVPPVNGTLLIFPNTAHSWHGHRSFTGRRYSVQLNYMTTDAKARSELRRHRISAFLKKLTMAA